MTKHDDFTIIIDTREQQPWGFEHYTTANRKLDTGDYSIEGLEEIICIERKKSINEIANNITESRFIDVVDRMSKFKYAFILLEFNLEQVLAFKSNGIQDSPTLDTSLKNGLNLSKEEQQAIIAFLKTLSDYTFIGNPMYAEPVIK